MNYTITGHAIVLPPPSPLLDVEGWAYEVPEGAIASCGTATAQCARCGEYTGGDDVCSSCIRGCGGDYVFAIQFFQNVTGRWDSATIFGRKTLAESIAARDDLQRQFTNVAHRIIVIWR